MAHVTKLVRTRNGKQWTSPTWYVRYTDAHGQRQEVKGYTDYAETLKLAHRLEDEKTRIQRGEVDPRMEQLKLERSKPIAEHVHSYKSHLQAAGRSDNHVAYTTGDIEAFIAHAQVGHASAITWGMMDAFVISRLNEDAPSTVNRRIGSVQAFTKHLHKMGILPTYPLEKYPKQKTRGREVRKRRALSMEEVTALLAHAPEPRNLTYRFALLTGFRLSEVASMSRENFDFRNRTITVFANDAKNKIKHQYIPMHPDLAKPLQDACRLLRSGNKRLFSLSRTEAARTLRADCEAAGVDPDRIDFHALRHTFITLLAQSGTHPKVCQKLARHSTLEMTLGYYTHWREDSEISAIAKLQMPIRTVESVGEALTTQPQPTTAERGASGEATEPVGSAGMGHEVSGNIPPAGQDRQADPMAA